MNILVNSDSNLIMQQRSGLCSCGNQLWYAINQHEGWAVCTRCEVWLWNPHQSKYHYGRIDAGIKHKLLLVEYETGDDNRRAEIMSIILGQHGNTYR